MGYCDVDDVAALMHEEFSNTSQPLQAEVQGLIENVSAVLEGAVQQAGYVTPVASAAALALLRQYAAFGVAPQVWHARYLAETAPARVVFWQDQFDQFLIRLQKGALQLPDAPLGAAGNAPAFDVARLHTRNISWHRKLGGYF